MQNSSLDFFQQGCEEARSCALKDKIGDLHALSVVPRGVIVGCVLLASDHLLVVDELPVGTGTDLINHGKI